MHPVLFEIGQFPIRSYGVAVALAFAIGIWLGRRRAASRGIDPDAIIDLAFFVIIASVLGARLTYVLIHWEFYAGDVLRMLKVWDGGLTLYGGILAGVVAGMIYFRRRGIDPWRGADLLTPSLALGIAIGRLGCFLNGCCYGKHCELPWAVRFPLESHAGMRFPGVFLHPTQIYESASAFLVFLVLLIIDRRKPFDGFMLGLFLILLAAARFLVDPLRHYESTSMVVEGAAFSMTSNQLIGLLIAGVGTALLLVLRRRGR